jgi:uncharacterized protein (DUF736 family)
VAWKKTRDDREYLSVRLEGPFTRTEVNCALFSNREAGFVWNRTEPKEPDILTEGGSLRSVARAV